MILMRKILILYLLITIFFTIQNKPCNSSYQKENTFKPLQTKAQEALKFCTEQNFNVDYCILMNATIHSGKNRIFLWDFKKDTIKYAGLCSHGCCSNPWGVDYSAENPGFSNEHGSHCSSLGKYKIGSRGWSNWGINVNYQLHGLESTNSNANARQIVLHGWNMVSETEVYPSGSPEGWGCPAVSNEFMKKADQILKNTDKAVLLWIYQ